MNPNSKYDTREIQGKARRRVLAPKTPLTPIKMFPAKLFGCNASPCHGFVDSPTGNKENIPFSMDLHQETSIIARPVRGGFAANKIPRSLGAQVGFGSRKPLRELSQVEVNARSTQDSALVSRLVFIAAPKSEQKAEYEGVGEGSFRSALSARSMARPRQPNTTTHSPFLIFVD